MIRVRMRREGLEVELRVPLEKLGELMDAANRNFGSPREIGGPEIKEVEQDAVASVGKTTGRRRR